MKPSERFLAQFVPLMEQQGYAYRKSQHRFVKRFAHGDQEYSLTFDARGGLTGVSAGFFIYFRALEGEFKKAVGYMCPWSAGATLLNAGAKPWMLWLNEDRFAAMTPKQRAEFPSEVIHPQRRIDDAVRTFADTHARYAVPFFEKLQTYRQLFDFYLEHIRNGFTGRCRPLPANVIYLSLLLAAMLGEKDDEIVKASKGVVSVIAGQDVPATVQAVKKYAESNPFPL